MKKIATHWQIIIALILATLLGLFFKKISSRFDVGSKPYQLIEMVVNVSRFLGDLFMRALKMIIVPLVVSSIISSLAHLAGLKRLKQLGLKTIGFYTLTTLLAAFVGLALVNIIQPGLSAGQPNAVIREAFEQKADAASHAIKDRFSQEAQDQAKNWKSLFYSMLPTNVLQAASDNGQLLGVLVFSVLFGMTMTQFKVEKIKPLRDVFTLLNEVMIKLTNSIMLFAPLGLFGMILEVTYRTGGEFFSNMLPYMATVLIALAIHMFVVLPGLLIVLAKVNPLAHFSAMKTALFTAFGTASSSSTLSVTMRCVQDKAKVSKQTASFTLPLGATVNMDGTALYECIAVIFVSQVMGFELSLVAQIGVVFAALLASVGVAGIPSASLVAILIIMKNVQIPGAEMAIFGLLAVDRLLDMSRTAVNVFGDSCAAVVIAKSEGEDVLSK